MDFERPASPQQPMDEYRPAPPVHHDAPRKKSKGKAVLMWLLVLVLMAGAGAAGYFYRDMEAKKQQKAAAAVADALRAENTKLKADLAAASAADAAAKAPSDEDLATIKKAVESGKYADLQGLLASPVSVILAASEGLGERTPAQAVADMKYLDDAKDPWNFSLTAAVLDGYRKGDYAKYFPQSAMVGKSADGYVVAFSFDETSGKVSTIFMANDEKLLTKTQQ